MQNDSETTIQNTAWPREPEHLLAIAMSERTQYDARGKALVTRAIFPHLGEELVIFVKIRGAEPDPAPLRLGAFPGMYLRIRDPRGWRGCSLGEHRVDPMYTCELASGMKPFAVLGKWLFQTHVHVVLVDCRGEEPVIGRTFEMAVPVDDPTVLAVRAGDVGDRADIALSLMAGTAKERRPVTPTMYVVRDTEAEDAEMDAWWMEQIEEFVRRFELVDRLHTLARSARFEDLTRFREQIEAYGGECWVGLAADIMDLFDPGGSLFLTIFWDVEWDSDNESYLRGFWRERFGFDEWPISGAAVARRDALVTRWTHQIGLTLLGFKWI